MPYAVNSLCAALLLAGLPAAVAGKPPPEEKTGVKVGQVAPAFKLRDQDGKERSLEEFLKHGKVALVFYRSADW